MRLKPFIGGTLLLIGGVWSILGLLALTLWTWFPWMTWMGILYTAFCTVLGLAFYLVERRHYERAREEHEGR